MSEPVSNVEIEDVLSSIRRLVSEDGRSAHRPEPPVKAAQTDRLVLTAALRVTEPPEPTPLTLTDPVVVGDTDSVVPETDVPEVEQVRAEPAVFDEASEQSETPKATDDDTDQLALKGDDSVSFFDQALGAPTGAETAEIAGNSVSNAPEQGADPSLEGEEAPWRDPNATLFQAAEPLDQPADDGFVTTQVGPEDTTESAAEYDDPFADRVEQPVVETDTDHNADGQTDVAPEATDGHPAEDAADIDAAPSAPVSMDDPLNATFEERFPLDAPTKDTTFEDTAFEETTSSDARAEPDPEIETLASGGMSDTATLSAKIAALEATIGQTLDQWEPDGESRDEYAGTPVETIQWQDHAAAPTAAPTNDPEQLYPDLPGYTSPPGPDAQEADAPGDDDTLDAMIGDDSILDEESLRELVADIVREELQGALGERITRNVRKLVRREIHRALTTQQLD